jgi:hypothetical protein
MITFDCPVCSRNCSAPDDKAGKTVKCNRCSQKITVPEQLAEDCGFELVDEAVPEGGPLPGPQVGVLCDACLKVFSAPPSCQTRCPSCGRPTLAPERFEVARSALAPPKSTSDDTQPVVNGQTRVACTQPAPSASSYTWTSEDLVQGCMFCVGGLSAVAIAVLFVAHLFSDKPEKKGYQPQYPEYHDHPGLAPVDRVKEWSPDDKARARDAIIGFEKTQGRMK